MSHKLISLSADLKKLQNEGFELEVKGAHLLIYDVPYVNSKKEILRGTLISKLTLAGDVTTRPEDHVIYFIGEYPCNNDGSYITAIGDFNQAAQVLTEELTVNYSFSAKPQIAYKDYYEKVTTYINILSHPVQSIDSSVTAKTFKVIEIDDPEIVFNYLDTNSSRAEIDIISSKLEDLKIAIVGLGGTGSYVLDLVAKTSVKEIHLFDGDIFLQHNAFRTPGAASKDDLSQQSKKVTYLHGIYSKIHKYVIPHDYHINLSNLEELLEMSFVFLCIDASEIKKILVEKLKVNGIPFIDAGVGVEVVEGSLLGIVRITTSSKEKNDHLDNRIPFSDGGNADYSQNIQIAELNALNAALAVIKWKKIFNFYHDQTKEYNTVYDISVNKLFNDEIVS